MKMFVEQSFGTTGEGARKHFVIPKGRPATVEEDKRTFRITSITDALYPQLEDVLTAEQLLEFINDPKWEVVIT